MPTVLVSYLLLTTSTEAIYQQLKRAPVDQNDSNKLSNRQDESSGAANDDGQPGSIAPGRMGRPTPLGHNSDQQHDANLRASSSIKLEAAASAIQTAIGKSQRPAGAMAAASTVTESETLQQAAANSTSTTRRKSATKSSHASTHANSTSSSTSAAPPAATTSQTVKVSTNKVNMTLATMPYEQVMCDNTTEVQSGSVLNATWLSRGKYANTVYVRYGTDGYSAWNLPPGGTLPPFAGENMKGDNGVQEPDAPYRMTFQTQVFAYQKGIKLSIVLYDNQQNRSVVTYESPEIFVRHQCMREKEIAKAAKTKQLVTDDPEDIEEAAADESTEADSEAETETDEVDEEDVPSGDAQGGMAIIRPPASTQSSSAASSRATLQHLTPMASIVFLLLSIYAI